MKLLARILSHGFAIALVLLLATGLIYRGELFPEYNLPGYLDIGKLAETKEGTTSGQSEQATAESGTVAPAQPTQVEMGSTAVESRVAAGETGGPAADASLEESSRQQESPSSPDMEAGAPAAMMEADAGHQADSAVPEPVDREQQPVSGKPAEGTAPVLESPVPAAAPAESMAEDTADIEIPADTPLPDSDATETSLTAVAAPEEEKKAYKLLAAAREAYWLRDYDVAESKYLALTRLEPDNPDGYGELGNMYFSQGQWDQAASAYYEAGVRLVGQGLLDQAGELAAVIRGLNGGQADDLDRKINAARDAAD